MQTEIVKSLFISENTQLLKVFADNFRRINTGVGRFYERNGEYGMSLTTFLSLSGKDSEYLNQWRDALMLRFESKKRVDEYVNATADYGTCFHILCADLCNGFVTTFEQAHEKALEVLKEVMPLDIAFLAANEMIKDLASFWQFVIDNNVEVIAIELPVMYDGLATQIDLVCEMDFNKKRQKAIINIKSGKSASGKEHANQLAIERELFNCIYQDLLGYSIDLVFNLHPTNWKKEPTFTLKNQTDAANDYIQNSFPFDKEKAKRNNILSPNMTKVVMPTGIINKIQISTRQYNYFTDEVN